MRDLIRQKISYLDATLSVLTILSLAVFCQILGFSLIIPILLLFVGLHLFFVQKVEVRFFLQLGFLLTLLLTITNYVKEYTTVPVLYIPVATVAMLTVLLYNDLSLAFLMSFLASVIFTLFIGADLNTMLIIFLGNLTAIYTVRDARTRGKVLWAGIYVSLVQVLAMLLQHHHLDFWVSHEYFFLQIRPLALNGIIAALVVNATLKIFESWFGVLTNFSLLELTDFNQPLLRRMVMEAPGTYQHSLVVSNIAEAAADAISANALLARVGAYYHDIGKLNKPGYFVENQMIGRNKHDNIEPSISRLVIQNHVKEGLELARKNKLSPIIQDFIVQHHGTSLMFYFYQKALEDSQENADVPEENYRYPGPKPQSRETAIVLLADSVEAATRSIDEPNLVKIEEMVRKVINNKFIDGQLDECTLTLKEIELIAKTFTRVLCAMYHGRIRYPDKKNGLDYRNPKSPEDGGSQPPAACPADPANS